jgi:hypothetical protein
MRDDSLAGDDQQVREDLKNLLRFTEQMLATREKTVFDIAEYPIRLTERDCVSAWKKAPRGGVIGVQKGPLC